MRAIVFSTDRFHVRYPDVNNDGRTINIPDQLEPWDVAADGVRDEIKANVGPIGGGGRCG